MRDLERTLRASAPAPECIDTGLEDRIWAAFHDAVAPEPLGPYAFQEPQLVIDDHAPMSRRPARLTIALGVIAAAAILVAAVAVAGLRDGRSVPAGRTTPATTPGPDPTATVGKTYREHTCPDPDRGACFDPFPAGRYTFHKANPQVTITVGDGWRVDSAYPWGTVLSRPDRPAATLAILNNAHAAQATACDLIPVEGEATDPAHLTTMFHVAPDLITGAPAVVRVGELLGYRVDVAPRSDAPTSSCHGVPTLVSPENSAGSGSWSTDLYPDMRMRVTLATTSPGRSVAVAGIVTGTQADLTAWMAVAQPVIDSITFRPCAPGLVFSQPCVF